MSVASLPAALLPAPAAAFTREAVPDGEGAVWGHVFDPNDCAGGCLAGGQVREVYLYGRCNAVPGDFGGIRLYGVDAENCPIYLITESGPLQLVHCVSGDRWTTISSWRGDTHVNGNPFAVAIVWGAGGDITFATDNGIANLYCSQGVTGTFPGCFSTVPTCGGYWARPTQKTFIYVTDFDGDTELDDLCEIYGAPYGLAFPYVYGYGYLANNLVLGAGLDCVSPSAVEPTTWGHVKALYE